MADPITYVETEEPYEIARKLIEKYHPDLQQFALRIVLRSAAKKAGKGKGGCPRCVLGTAEVIKGRFAFYAMSEDEIEKQLNSFGDPYQMFWIELSGEHWYDLSDEQKAALIDHELCHCKIEDGEWTLVEHDIEDFNEIVDRHGGWVQMTSLLGVGSQFFVALPKVV